ncbi:MAG: Gfo/Idh/MocA family oxidoreductase, partial [Phycisphaeraceae bacterium]
MSCSYGPGRYDADYEERGQDYPAAYVRWTEQRNMQSALDLMGRGELDVSPLISHRYRIEDAEQAYAMIEAGDEPYLGIVLEYPELTEPPARRIDLPRKVAASTDRTGRVGIGVLGAGNFARMVLLPKIVARAELNPTIICSAGGVSASQAGKKLGFATATSDETDVLNNPDVDAVFVITQHDQHARQVLAAIEAGKHVFVEKPLCLNADELAEIEAALAAAGTAAPLVMVGFNRRFSPAAQQVRAFYKDVTAPLSVSFRFNAGEIPPDHWTQHPTVGGGRIIGEACHAIDFATYLVDSPVVRVFAESIGGPNAPTITEDQCFITLRHANGSISNIAYLAGGDKAFPKERIEVIGAGRVAVIDDFRVVTTVAGGKT